MSPVRPNLVCMKVNLLASAVILASLVAGPLAAQVPAPPARPPATGPQAPAGTIPDPTKPDGAKQAETPRSLDGLFERLAKAADAEEAKGVASLIERRWGRSGSDVADLLMSRAAQAMSEAERGQARGGQTPQNEQSQDLPLAIELLDRVIQLEPGWAEAWNRRATAFYMLGDMERALLDVRETLQREPRHFSAIAGLGHIFHGLGDTRKAVQAYRRALALHPHFGDLPKMVERLAPEADGRDI